MKISKNLYSITLNHSLWFPTLGISVNMIYLFLLTPYLLPANSQFSEKKIMVMSEGPSQITPEVTFLDVWTEHNVNMDGRMGMKIHAKFSINNVSGQSCKLMAFFQTQSGQKLEDQNGRYNYRSSAGNNVAVGRAFKPAYDRTIYNNASLFMPYDELHVQGENHLEYFVSVFYQGSFYGRSREIPFNLTHNSRPNPTSGGQVTARLLNCGCDCSDYTVVISGLNDGSSGELNSDCTFVSDMLIDGVYEVKLIPPGEGGKADDDTPVQYMRLSRSRVLIEGGRNERISFEIVRN